MTTVEAADARDGVEHISDFSQRIIPVNAAAMLLVAIALFAGVTGACLHGQCLARLFLDDVVGVPVRPVVVMVAAGPLLMRAMGGSRAPERRCKIAWRAR